jgi:hypothetical protein
LSEEAKVSEFIEENPVQWKETMIRTIFEPEEAELICNIPLSNYHHMDKMIWHPTSSGEFSVKSAYHLEKKQQDRKQGESSNQGRGQAIWKTIWGLKVPNSSKVFWWRACKNIPPAKDNLRRRGILDEDFAFSVAVREKWYITSFGHVHRSKMCEVLVVVSFKSVKGAIVISWIFFLRRCWYY